MTTTNRSKRPIKTLAPGLVILLALVGVIAGVHAGHWYGCLAAVLSALVGGNELTALYTADRNNDDTAED